MTERRCRVCGCTEDRGCPPDRHGRSCWWLAPDLCSRCIPEAELQAAFSAEFFGVDGRADLLLRMAPLTGFLLLGQLQLALRHPGNQGKSARLVRTWAEILEGALDLPPAMAEVARRGWDPAHDVERGSARPRTVCLCGSTRFYQQFREANYQETMAGRIVLTVGFYPHSTEQAHGEHIGISPEQKQALDELHLRKIDQADEILVLNVDGYVGDSTRREIAYAAAHNKPVRWWDRVRVPPELVL